MAPDAAESPLWTSDVTGAVIFIVAVGWWVGAMACVIASLGPQPRLRALGDETGASERFEKLGVKFVKKPDDGKMKGLAFITDPDGYWIEILWNRV